METPSELGHLAKAIRGLTIAVWCLVALTVIQLGGWLVALVAPQFYARHLTDSASRAKFESWEGLSFEERVKRASVIVITDNRQEGGKIHAIVKEVLKKAPNTTFYYGVGDEYGPASVSDPRPDTRYGDGALILFAGSPAMNQGSYAIYGGTIPGLGEMPVAKAKEIIARSK